jgi:bifunctional ADP-heptose synthase (sugar kinase/adenylyltransferase)
MQKKLNSLTELEVTQQQKQFRVLLIGDSCIDKYIYGTCDRISPEAPVPILRYEREEYREGMAFKCLGYDLPQDNFDALVISDYCKGLLTNQRIFELVEWFDGPIFIDSKKTCLPVDHAYIKINEDEYSRIEQKDSPNLIITKGSNGADYRGKNYPGIDVGVYDVCGAGDTFLSALVYFYLLCGKIETAIPYANKAASIAVSNFGTYILNQKDIDEIRR